MPKGNPSSLAIGLTKGDMFFIPKSEFPRARGALQQRRGYLRRSGFDMCYFRDRDANGYVVWAVPTLWSRQ